MNSLNIDKFRYALEKTSKVLVVNPLLIITYANERFCAFYHLTVEEVIGMPLNVFFFEYQADILLQNILDDLGGDEIWQGEVRAKNKTNEATWMHLTVMVFDEMDSPREYIFILRDISVQKNNEERLKRFYKIFNQVSENIFISDAATAQIIDVSNSARDSLGYTREELLQMKISDIEIELPVHTAEQWNKHLEEIKKANKLFIPYAAHKRKDGSSFPVEITVRYEEYEGKGYLIGVARNISERLKNEAIALENQKRFQLLSEATFESITLLENGVCVDANAASTKLLGYSYEELIGMHAMQVIAPESQGLVLQNIKNKYESPYEAICQRKDGTKFYAEIQGKMVEHEGKEVRVTSLRDITYRKETEKELVNINQQLNEVQDFAMFGYWKYYFETKKLEWSKNIFLSFGLNPDLPEPSLEEYKKMIHPDDYKDFANKAHHSIENSQPFVIEMRHLQPDKSYKWFFTKTNILKDENNKPIYLSGILIDIDKLKRMELERNELGSKLQAFYDTPLIGIAITNKGKKVLQINQKYCDILGYKPEESKELEWTATTHPEDLEKDKLLLEKVLNNELDNYIIEKRYIRKDGQEIYAEVSMQCIRNEKGEVNYLIFLAKDITERKKAEQKIKESEQKFSKIFYSSPLYVVISTIKDDIFVDVNSSLAENFGYTREEMIGKTCYDLNIINPVHKQMTADLIQKHGFYKDLEVTYYKKSGEEVIGLATAEIIYMDNEPCIIQSIIDITQRKKTEDFIIKSLQKQKRLNEELSTREEELAANEEELKQINYTLSKSNDELLKTNQELDRFVYSVSHDLRAPLTSVLGLIQICRITDDLTQIYEYLRLQEISIKKLDNFIKEILDYSQNMRLEVSSELINFEDLINSVLEQYSYLENFEAIERIINISQTSNFYSNERRLNIIFNNLISNAIRYANPYQEKPFVSITIQTNDREAMVEIQDNGIGIAEEHLPKIFDMFYRATTHKSGSGLGLYIVKETLQKLNAEIFIQSQLGEGTSIRLKIPNLTEEYYANQENINQ